jgi:hypothetical protein
MGDHKIILLRFLELKDKKGKKMESYKIKCAKMVTVM